MKKQIDPDLIDTEPEPVRKQRIILSDQEAYLFACIGFITLKGINYYRIKRFNTRIEAEKDTINPGDVIIETRITAFIVSPNSNVCGAIVPALNLNIIS